VKSAVRGGATSNGRRQRSARLSRERIVTTAAQLADSEGMEAVTLSRVADDLGCHVTSLRNYVETVAELHRSVALFAIAELKEALWEASIGRSREDALWHIAIAYRRYGEEHPGLAQALRAYRNDADPQFRATSEKVVAPILATLRSFGLDDDHAAILHRVFSSAIGGFTTYEAAGFTGGAEADAVFDHIVRLLIHGLTNQEWLTDA
jgi:AcrR family transcriptional regulator